MTRARIAHITRGGALLVVAAMLLAACGSSSKPATKAAAPLHKVAAPTTTPTAKAAPVKPFVWPFYGYRHARTRAFNPPADLDPPFHTAWAFGGNALLEFPPVIWGNNLYFIDDGATVKRVNIRTGKRIWQRHLGVRIGQGVYAGRSASSPALDMRDGLLVVSVLSTSGSSISSFDGEVAALSLRSGKIVWAYPVPSGSESSPMVVGSSVYFGDQGGTMTSLNVQTGKVNWTLATSGPIKEGPAYHDDRLLFGTYGGSFYSVDAKTGAVAWSVTPGGAFYSTPAVAYGHVYVGNNDGEAYAFDLSSGAIAWSRGLGGYVYSGPAVANVNGLGPTVYIGSYDGYLYALDAASGATRWDYDVGGAISGSATLIGNTVYCSTVYEQGSWGFNAVTGKKVFYRPHGSYTPVIADRNAVFLIGKYVIYKLVPRR